MNPEQFQLKEFPPVELDFSCNDKYALLRNHMVVGPITATWLGALFVLVYETLEWNKEGRCDSHSFHDKEFDIICLLNEADVLSGVIK